MSVEGDKLQPSPLSRAEGLLLHANTPKGRLWQYYWHLTQQICPGRGVFASQTIPKGTVIDVSPVLVFNKDEVELHTSQTILQHYTYYWPDPAGGAQTQAIALGLGSMFNHSTKKQNVIWSRNIAAGTIIYTAHRDILRGEELCISYGNARLWFKDADLENETTDLKGKDEITQSGLDIFMVGSSDEDDSTQR
ncbi:hypothetical protein LTR64_005263 [Lithohypha guttulata]|uniref:uncharacterized protein n=1 Tax=Lithohypha guttulata TaxID=1690604 RepID=UPI00315DB273